MIPKTVCAGCGEKNGEHAIDCKDLDGIRIRLEKRIKELEVWEDGDDEWSAAIKQAHPTVAGAHLQYATAMKMVGNRRSKGELVALVTWLIVRKGK